MKTIRKSLFCSCAALAAVLCAAVPAAAGNPAAGNSPAFGGAPEPVTCPAGESLEMKLAHLDREIGARALALNYLVWEKYLGYAGRGRIVPGVVDYPGMDYRTVRDTVPEIARLDAEYRFADSLYTAVLATYPEYRDIHREYVALKGVNDKERQNRNRERYNLMYRYLRDNDPGYLPAYERRQEALRVRNMAVVRFLLDYYRSQGREMPTAPLITTGSYLGSGTNGPKVSMRYLRQEYPEIGRQEEELGVLRKLRPELFEKVQQQRYDLQRIKRQASLPAKPR